VPFAALLDPATGRFLVEDRPVGYLPSASVLLALQRRQPGGTGRAVVVGEPSREHSPPIPWARREAEEIARLLGARPLLGPQATEARIRQALSEPGVTCIHIASHGFFDDREWAFSRLYLASDPAFRDDGVLDAYEIAHELALPDAQLVTLAGCETGLGEATGGDEVLGLVRAFMVAGSRRVLASRWVIRDEPSARLMIRFYTELGRGVAPPEALRRAQRELLHDPATSHPADWAAFMLVGDPAPWIPKR
jgi:CHAT domain-containing protein